MLPCNAGAGASLQRYGFWWRPVRVLGLFRLVAIVAATEAALALLVLVLVLVQLMLMRCWCCWSAGAGADAAAWTAAASATAAAPTPPPPLPLLGTVVLAIIAALQTSCMAVIFGAYCGLLSVCMECARLVNCADTSVACRYEHNCDRPHAPGPQHIRQQIHPPLYAPRMPPSGEQPYVALVARGLEEGLRGVSRPEGNEKGVGRGSPYRDTRVSQHTHAPLRNHGAGCTPRREKVDVAVSSNNHLHGPIFSLTSVSSDIGGPKRIATTEANITRGRCV